MFQPVRHNDTRTLPGREHLKELEVFSLNLKEVFFMVLIFSASFSLFFRRQILLSDNSILTDIRDITADIF